MQQKIIILDFGSQTTQLIGRRVRELDTFCEILPYNKYPEDDSDVTPASTDVRFWRPSTLVILSSKDLKKILRCGCLTAIPSPPFLKALKS